MLNGATKKADIIMEVGSQTEITHEALRKVFVKELRESEEVHPDGKAADRGPCVIKNRSPCNTQAVAEDGVDGRMQIVWREGGVK